MFIMFTRESLNAFFLLVGDKTINFLAIPMHFNNKIEWIVIRCFAYRSLSSLFHFPSTVDLFYWARVLYVV